MGTSLGFGTYSDFYTPPQSIENPNSRSDFALMVDKTLTQCRQLKLKKFKVDTFYDIQFEWQFNNWIRFAISCNVQELDLSFRGRETEFLLDQYIFINSRFTNLRLARCKLNPSGAISWENLRSLSIFYYQTLDEELIENILSGSPVLETLELDNFSGYRQLDITSKSVKNLVLIGYEVPDGKSEADVIKINAPNILSLTIKGTFLCKNFVLNVSSLVKAYINYTCTKPKEEEQEMLKGCIMNLRHVKELELGSFCYEVLSCLEAKGFVFASNVKLTERM